MDNSNDWMIRPLEGFGRLEFGMTQEQVSAFDPIYGKVGIVRPVSTELNETIENIRKNGSFETEQEINEIIDEMKKIHARTKNMITEFRDQNKLKLIYKDDILYEIFLDNSLPNVLINERNIFTSDPNAVFQELQIINKDNPYYDGGECVFRNLCIYMFNFFEYGSDIYFFKKGDEDYEIRTISLLSTLRTPEEGSNGSIAIDFLK